MQGRNKFSINSKGEQLPNYHIKYIETEDLKKIPDELKNDIVMQFDRAVCGKRDKLFNYFVTNKLQNLMENIGDF